MLNHEKNWLRVAWIGFVACVFFSVLAWIIPAKLYYPIISIQNDNLVTTVISRPVYTGACETSLQNQLQNIHAACPNCLTGNSSCNETLSDKQKLLISAAPLAQYSALLPNGFAIYESADPSIAQKACLQSELQAHAKGFLVRCYAPNEARYLTGNKPLAQSWTEQGAYYQ